MAAERWIFWHRRDLRLADNLGLATAAAATPAVTGVFVLDPAILGAADMAPARVWFLLESLRELQQRWREAGSCLLVLEGDPEVVLPQLAEALAAPVVAWNRDVEPYGRARDRRVATALQAAGRRVLVDWDQLLVAPEVSVVALRAPEPHPYGVGRQWYGLQPIDWSQLPAARELLRQRLTELDQSVPLSNTVLLGFSQGGAMALDVGSSLPLAGIVACSGYPHEGWEPVGSLPPVLLSHGREDPVVPFAASEAVQEQLLAAGHNAELLAFNGGHTIDAALLPQISAFVRQQLNTQP